MLVLPSDLRNKTKQPSPPVKLPPSPQLDLLDPSGYEPDPGLQDAIKVALLLRKPILVTGEPGTGKTQLGRYLAWKMNFLFFKFDAKSSSVSRDLYYQYDALGRFQASQGSEKTEARAFLQFHALGEAILQSLDAEALQKSMGGRLPDNFSHKGPQQSVVVIDEIDKAPRDFPNDLLNELDQSFFRIPELGIPRIGAGRELEPVLVITSNSEKNLPAPFLRRCVYYNIEFPKDSARLHDIVASRIEKLRGENTPLLDGALQLFEILRRDATGLTKKPATAELLDWMLALLALQADPAVDLRAQSDLVGASLPALIKHAADRPIAVAEAERWMSDKAS